MLAFLSRFSTSAIVYTALAIIALLGAAAGVQTVRLSLAKASVTALTAERDAARGERDALVLANASNVANVHDLRGRLVACVGEQHRIEQAEAQAQDQLTTANRDRARLAATLKRERETAYAQDPACGRWRGDALCPAASDGLRLVWQTADRHRDAAGDGAREAVRPDPGQPDQGAGAGAAADAGADLHAAADCYSNAQLFDALEAAVAWGSGLADQLDAISTLQDKAVSADASQQRP